MKFKQALIEWLARRLPSCKEVTRMASESMERKLPLRQRLEVKLHLLVCSLCMRYVKQLQLMREVAHQHNAKIKDGVVSPHSALSAKIRERMKRSLQF